MNLLEKYKAMVTTTNLSPLSLVVDNKSNIEGESNFKMANKETTSRIGKTPFTEKEVSNRLAITPSEIVEPGPIVNAIWVNPHKQGTPEARQESLLQVIYAIWEPSFDRIAAIWPRGFVSTQEIRTAGLEIERIHAFVLSGKAKLVDFRKAAEEWEAVVRRTTSH